MSPYRTSAAPIELATPYSWQDKFITKLRRKFLIWSKGSFKKRFPFRCSTCNRKYTHYKRTHIVINDVTILPAFTYSPCGHTCKQSKHKNYGTQGGGLG